MKNEVSCINTRSVLDYINHHYDGDSSVILQNLDPLIDAKPNPEAYLRDPNNWISCELVSEIFKRCRLFLNDDMVMYKVGKYSVENISLGYVQQIIFKAFWSLENALKHVQKLNDKWNRNKKVELVSVKNNEAVVQLHWNSKMNVSKDFCLINQGTYTFLPTIWGSSPLRLKETCCQFEGALYCEYHLEWPKRNRIYEIWSRFFTSRSVLQDTIAEMEADKRVIEEKYEEVSRLNEKLYKKYNEVNYLNDELKQKVNQLQAIHNTGKAILSVLDLDQLLAIIMNTLSNICKVDRSIIMLIDKQEEYLVYLYGIGISEDTRENIKDYRIPLDRVNNILVRVINKGHSEYINDVKNSNLKKENELLKKADSSAVYVVPLTTGSRVIGVIAADAVKGNEISRETRETLEVFAPQIAIAIANAALYQELQEQMEELKQSQALLSRADKLSYLGNMAARLAHEIKNPMLAIQTFIRMVPENLHDKEFMGAYYNIALEETNRVNDLIMELLDLVKTKETKFELYDIHDLINKMVLLVSPQSKEKDIEIKTRFDSNIREILIDSEKMKQVILNILVNGIEAVPERGLIEIITRRHNGSQNSDKVIVEIKDNGKGIPADMINHIFDPYFTTKHKSDLHSGTGLGLFVSHKNIEEHGGCIEVKKRIGKGTSFILTLPVNQPD